MGAITVALAIAFLAGHLVTDARRMIKVLRWGHTRYHDLNPCPRCKALGAGVKEAWWEIVTLAILIGHVVLDFAQ